LQRGEKKIAGGRRGKEKWEIQMGNRDRGEGLAQNKTKRRKTRGG